MVTLLLAATVGWSAPDERFLAVLAVHVQEVGEGATATPEEPQPSVATIPYYYERISTIPVPQVPLLSAWDPRLPRFRIKP